VRISNRLIYSFFIISAIILGNSIWAGESYFERQRAKAAIESTYGVAPTKLAPRPVLIHRDGGILIPVGNPPRPH